MVCLRNRPWNGNLVFYDSGHPSEVNDIEVKQGIGEGGRSVAGSGL